MPQERRDYYREKDPVKQGRALLIEQGGVSEEAVQAIEADVERAMAEAIEYASNSPEPSVQSFLEEIETY